MKKESFEISGYGVLPLQLPQAPSFSEPATHFLYLRPHEPRIPDPDSSRSLFVVNLPIDTTETHLRHLFGSQLSAGRVEKVQFEDVPIKKQSQQANTTSSKKRKRITADELQNHLEKIDLPATWNRELQKSGTHAVIIFVDKPSKEASLKAAHKAAKRGTKLVWGQGIEDRVPELGLDRYLAHERLRYPNRAELLRTVNEYMNVFTQVAEVRRREEASRTQVPDEDGFVTVTHGPKLNSVAREDETKELVKKQQEKTKGLEDFYRFQSREKRKERQNDLLRKFDEDKKRLQEMKQRRGKIRVSFILLSTYSVKGTAWS